MLKPSKSPGLDGLPGIFYQVFWSELKPYFYNSLIYTFNNNDVRSSKLSSNKSYEYRLQNMSHSISQ